MPDKASTSDGYITFLYTPISIKPPPEFSFDEPRDRFNAKNSFIQLEKLKSRGFKPESDTIRQRPIHWQDSSNWKMDTLINGRWFTYSSKIRAAGYGSNSQNKKAENWEGILRFGSPHNTFYLVADTRDVSRSHILSLEKTLLSGRFEGYLSDFPIKTVESKDRALFDLDLSGFDLGERKDGTNIFSYQDNSAMIEFLRYHNNPSSDTSSTKNDLESILALSADVILTEYVTITQYGKGTGEHLIPFNFAVIVGNKRLENPMGIRGNCKLGEKGRMKFGEHQAFFSRYACREGVKDIDGAIFAIQIEENVFKIDYEVIGWSSSKIKDLEVALSKIKLKG